MQLTAKLIHVLPLQSGIGKNGEWKKKDIIVETAGQFPKKICVSVWGDKINESQLKVGNELKIDFDIESREFNGKWYTDIKAWKIELGTAPEQSIKEVDNSIDTFSERQPEDDLPF